MTNEIKNILTERGSNYGDFGEFALVSITLKSVVEECGNKLSAVQKEALDMIMHKIARILNGNPNYADSWADIAGYAQLVVNELQKTK